MKVLLVRPPTIMGREHAHALQHPVNLCWLAAAVIPRGFQPEILDFEVVPYSPETFIAALSRLQPAVIGYTAMTPSIDFAAGLAAAAKQALPEVKNIVGGPHVSILPEATLGEYPQFDAAVFGEGEAAFLKICEAARDGVLGDSPIASAVIRTRDSLVGSRSEPAPPLDLDSLPFPARELLDLSKYRGAPTPGIPGSVFRATQLFTARGCPGACTFCCSKDVFGRKVRARSVGNVLAEVKDCIDRFSFNHFTIDNDTFTFDRNYVMEFCEGIAPLGVTWDCDTRVDRVDGELLRTMARAGCVKIAFGIESGSPRILKLIKKGTTIEQAREAFAQTKKTGMLSCAFLMIGSHPEETEEDIKLTERFVREISPDLITVALATPYPGTEFEASMKESGLLEIPLPWSAYSQSFHGRPIARTKTLSPEKLQKLQSRLLRSFYFRPSYIFRRLASIRKPGEIVYWFSAGVQFIAYMFQRRGKEIK